MADRSATAFRVVVEEGSVHRFASAIGSTCAAHHRDNDPVAPPTFLVTAADWQRADHRVWPGLVGREARMLHGAQRVELSGRAPRAGDVLSATETLVEERRARGRRGGELTLTTVDRTFRSPTGALVAQHREVWVETDRPSLDPSEAPSDAHDGPAVLEHDAGPLRLADTIAYQAASGDLNPIHHDPDLAHRAGYPAPFGVGMRQAGVLAALLAAHYGHDAVRLLEVRFLAIAWHGEALSYRVHQRIPLGEADVHELAVRVLRPDGEAHLAGRAVVRP